MLSTLCEDGVGGLLMLEYQKSSAAFSLTAQLLVCVKFSGAITAVRSCVRMGWVGDDFWYPSMRNPPTPSSHSELSNKSTTSQTCPQKRILKRHQISTLLIVSRPAMPTLDILEIQHIMPLL